MPVQITDEMRGLIDFILSNSGFESTEEVLLSALKHLASEFERDEECEDYGAPEHLCVTTREQLEAAIREGLKSPSREYTKKDFEDMRWQLVEKYIDERVRQELESRRADMDSAPHSGQR